MPQDNWMILKLLKAMAKFYSQTILSSTRRCVSRKTVTLVGYFLTIFSKDLNKNIRR